MENILTKVENNVFYINTSVKILESKEISMKNRIRICKVKAKLNDGSNIPATFSIENAGFNHYEIKLIPSNIKNTLNYIFYLRSRATEYYKNVPLLKAIQSKHSKMRRIRPSLD